MNEQEIRAQERERCAQVALSHRDSAVRRRNSFGRGPLSNFDEDMRQEIIAEERGENIAAEMIAKAIRALI